MRSAATPSLGAAERIGTLAVARLVRTERGQLTAVVGVTYTRIALVPDRSFAGQVRALGVELPQYL